MNHPDTSTGVQILLAPETTKMATAGRIFEPLTMRNLSVTYCPMPLDKTIAALGDPTRREILRRLADAPHRAGELASGFAISRPAICKHTRLLTSAGLIRARQSGRERIYELAPSGGKAMRAAIERLEAMERFWEVALGAFKRYAEKEA